MLAGVWPFGSVVRGSGLCLPWPMGAPAVPPSGTAGVRLYIQVQGLAPPTSALGGGTEEIGM